MHVYYWLVRETADVLGSTVFGGWLESALFVVGRLAAPGRQGWRLVELLCQDPSISDFCA